MAQRSFKLPDDLDAELVAKAAKLDRSVSWVILRCIETGLYGEERAHTRALIRSAGGRFERFGDDGQEA